MKCKECEKLNMRSTLTPGPQVKVAQGVHVQFYDEDGHYHYHDPQVFEQSFDCSKGHKTVLTQKNGCPTCGEQWRSGEVK